MTTVEPYYQDATLTLLTGKAEQVLPTLEPGSAACVVTSPPYYGLRDYGGHPDQLGLEDTPAEYMDRLVTILGAVRQVLSDTGSLWLNLGDTRNAPSGAPHTMRAGRQQTGEIPPRRSRKFEPNLPRKTLLMLPDRIVWRLIDEQGWSLRSRIVWAKTNPQPESVADRVTSSWESLFHLTKSDRYWFDVDAVRTVGTGRSAGARDRTYADRAGAAPGGERFGGNPGSTLNEPRDLRRLTDVWPMSTAGYPGAHFATFPLELPRRCILAGCRPGGVVLDPFSGAGTTAMAAQQLGRPAIGIDLNSRYHDIALRRMSNAPLPFDDAASAL